MSKLYALVIVDVPAMQTNHPYTYLVPKQLHDQVAVGKRVIVGFGKGDRHVQGFIVDLREDLPTQAGVTLKEVQEVLDLEPVITQEGLQLADWLADHTFAFKIRCLQVLLPNALKAAYNKTLKRLQPLDDPQIDALFGQSDEIDLAQLPAQFQNQIIHYRHQGKVEIIYHVKDKVAKKQVPAFKLLLTSEQLDQVAVSPRATKQLAMRDYLKTLEFAKLYLQKPAQAASGLTSADFRTAAKKGWLEQSQVEQYRDPYADKNITATKPLELTPDQNFAVKSVQAHIDQKDNRTFLLQGVTGSGKTEVYLQMMAYALKQGRQALMLVPEISLTPQMMRRVKGRFGDLVAVMHSGLSAGERYDEWRRIERKEARVVIGARSAIFAPLDNIGIIIMDEEHEASYKQDEMPRYHARDVALWRARYHHCPVVLGSATPSLESRARAMKNVYTWLTLPKRVNGQALPKVELIDMRNEGKYAPVPDISNTMLNAIKDRLIKGEQTVLLLNRRGYSSFVMCRECGYVLKCPNCDVSLTLHMDSHSMRCHYCGHEEAIPQTCDSCHSRKIRYYGTGTQKVEEQLQGLLPTARIIRMDVDTTRKKGAHERLLQAFGNKEADILLGTQMIAKGLDFPDVTLVGVLNADTALDLPDFRASERTFQLLTQVAGRAGRAQKAGQVLIQTYNPQHYAIQLAKGQDYERYFQTEMGFRHRVGYPPYYYTIQITASYDNEAATAKKMFTIAGELGKILSPQAQVLGPTPKAIMRIKNRYYYQLVIKYKHEPLLEDYLKGLLIQAQTEEKKGLKLVIDRDPLNFI
ncbi:primosomal protein N' [Ligilactobacillus equi]|uniref:primosomal protein N' n=1 Tax=Ligilactobacillus equi TaxID=137357 RepID=UPI002ED2EE96